MREVQATRGATLRKHASGGIALGLGLIGVAADQLTKVAALTQLEPGVPVEILGKALRFTLIRNPGAAFGLGSGMTLALSIFAILALVGCLFVGVPRVRRPVSGVALGLLLAGVAGNLYDRLFREPAVLLGHVIDFIQLPYFAIFNVADMCITTAAALIVWMGFKSPKEAPEAAA